jgi:hypothetical protein
MDERSRSGSGSSTGSNIQQHWNTPLTVAQSKLSSEKFDSYAFVGKKGDETVVYGSGDYSESSELIDSIGQLETTD